MVGTSVYCKIAPPSVVRSSRSEGETDNDTSNDNDRINVRNNTRKNIKMTPEERREYISSLLVVKVSDIYNIPNICASDSVSDSNLKEFLCHLLSQKVIRKSYADFQNEQRADEGDTSSSMSLQSRFRRYLYLLGASDTSRTSSSSLDEDGGSDNNDNIELTEDCKMNNSDDIEKQQRTSSANISNTKKGDLILVDRCDNDGVQERSKVEGPDGSPSSCTSQIRRRDQTCVGEEDENTSRVCAICLNEYEDGEEICWSSNRKCNHVFHHSCIAEWLLQHDECPYCRKAYLVDDDASDDGYGIDEEQNRHTSRRDDRDDRPIIVSAGLWW